MSRHGKQTNIHLHEKYTVCKRASQSKNVVEVCVCVYVCVCMCPCASARIINSTHVVKSIQSHRSPPTWALTVCISMAAEFYVTSTIIFA